MNISALKRLSFLSAEFDSRSNPANNSSHNPGRHVPVRNSIAADNRPDGEIGTAQAPGQQRLRYQQELALILQQQQVSNDATDASQAAEAIAAPTQETQLKTLATRYVEQYQRSADIKLSQEQFEQRIEEVYNFYSQSSRAGRLERIVF